MSTALVVLVAAIPALLLGYVMPDIFAIFDLQIEGPASNRYKVLSALLYSPIVAAAFWIIWMASVELTLIKFLLAVLSATAISMVGTMIRKEMTPLIRVWIRRGARWLYKKTV